MAKTLATLLNDAAKKLESFDFGAAASLYQEALKLQPGNAAAAMGMAMVLNRTERPAEALRLLGQIWNAMAKAKGKGLDTSRAAVLAQIAYAQQHLGQFSEALQSFRMANSLKATPELAERIKALQKAVEQPEPIEQLIIQARQYMRTGKVDDAINVFKAALQLNVNHPEALHGLGMVLRLKGELSAALPFLQQAIILTPERHDYFNDLGMLFQDQNELQKAVSFHNRALKLKPDFAPAFINLGVAYKRLGKYDEAVMAYRKAIELQPNMPEAHNNLGNLLRLQGDLDGARVELKKAISLRPGYIDAQQNLEAVESLLQATAPAKSKKPVKPAATKPKTAVKTPVKKASPAKPTAPKKTTAKAPGKSAAPKAGTKAPPKSPVKSAASKTASKVSPKK